VLSLRFIAFALTPTVVLVLAAETSVRLKYFFSPYGRDWTYLTTPIGRGSVFAATSAPTKTRSAAVSLASREDAASEDQLVFRWQTPCVNSMVFSSELGKEMPRTWDEHCFRGDRVTPAKNPDEYRVVFLGGSTVEDGQSDAEMMTEQFKRALPPSASGKHVTVVNAGKANFDSRVIRSYWDSVVKKFSPDLVVYYEAWNEQQGDIKFTGMRVDQGMAAFTRYRLHRMLYYRSMLYTYLVERFGLRLAAARNRFWKVDLKQLRHFVELSRAVRATGARFVLATQIVRFPRMWKGVDTVRPPRCRRAARSVEGRSRLFVRRDGDQRAQSAPGASLYDGTVPARETFPSSTSSIRSKPSASRRAMSSSPTWGTLRSRAIAWSDS
jgi:hypothetical protein